MKEFKDKFEELGEMIKSAHEFGNDHHDREDQFKLFNEIKVLVEKFNLPGIKVLLPDKDNYHYLRGFVDGQGVQEPIDKDDYPEPFNNIDEIIDRVYELKANKDD